MPYTNGDGVAHSRRTCRRLHNTGTRIRRVEDVGDRTPCEHCGDGVATEPNTCDTVKTDGEVCGRELPCPYHSE